LRHTPLRWCLESEEAASPVVSGGGFRDMRWARRLKAPPWCGLAELVFGEPAGRRDDAVDRTAQHGVLRVDLGVPAAHEQDSWVKWSTRWTGPETRKPPGPGSGGAALGR